MTKSPTFSRFAAGTAAAFTLVGSSAGGLGLQYTSGSAQPASKLEAAHEMAGAPMVLTEDVLNARLEAVEARTETKFEKLLGELRLIGERVGNLSTSIGEVKTDVANLKTDVAGVRTATAGVKWNIVALGLTLGGLFIAIAAFGVQIMDIAFSLVGLGAK